MTPHPPTDPDLLRTFTATRSPEAFRQLVNRHLPIVHAAATRILRNTRPPLTRHADDIAQSVFLLLAQNAAKIPPKTPLIAWLYKVTHYACSNLQRLERIRQKHEQESAAMRPTTSAPPTTSDAEALLDPALLSLSEPDRTALLLRYTQNLSVEQIATLTQVPPETAKKRLHRALTKLRKYFATKGMLSAAPLALHALAPAPAHAALAATITTTALTPLTAAAAKTTSYLIAKSVTHMLNLAKLAKAAAILAVLTTITVASFAVLPSKQPTPPTPVAAPGRDLPVEIQAVLTRYQQNLSAVHSLEAQGSFEVVSDAFLNYPDLDGRRFNKQNGTVVYALDGTSWFAETSIDLEFEPGKKQVRYHLPFGAAIMPQDAQTESRLNALYRTKGILQLTNRFLSVDDKLDDYRVEDNVARINAKVVRNAIEHDYVRRIKTGAWFGSDTIDSYMHRIAEKYGDSPFSVQRTGKNHVVTITIGGQSVDGKEMTDVVTVTFNPDHNYAIESVECLRNNSETLQRDKYIYAQFGDTWVMTGMESYDAIANRPLLTRIMLQYDPKTMKLNEPVAPSRFSREALGIKKGAFVQDAQTGESYLFDDVPLHVKIAKVATSNVELADRLLAKSASRAEPNDEPIPASSDKSRDSQPSVTPIAEVSRPNDMEKWLFLGTAGLPLGILMAIILLKLGRKQRIDN